MPQIQCIDKIVDAPVAVTQQAVPVENLSQDRPTEWVHDAPVAVQEQDYRKLAPKKRKSTFESDMMVDKSTRS